jgi:hypothetical protein
MPAKKKQKNKKEPLVQLYFDWCYECQRDNRLHVVHFSEPTKTLPHTIVKFNEQDTRKLS